MWTIALALNVIHLAYHQFTTNVDLFPFNNIRHYRKSERMMEVAVNALTMGFPVIALLSHSHKMTGIACWVLGFLLVGEFLSWWPYYFWGVPKLMKKWQEIYDRTHQHTIIVLPAIRNHPVPNLEHCILHVMTTITFAATVGYYFNS